MARNPGTRLGRPPKPKVFTQPRHPTTGERQGRAPSDALDMAVPGAAFRRGGHAMPRHHDDPAFCGGGPTKRR